MLVGGREDEGVGLPTMGECGVALAAEHTLILEGASLRPPQAQR